MARTPIAQRTLEIRIGRHRRSVTVRLVRPTRRRTGEYACTYELASRQLRYRRTQRIFGEDGIQALLLALGMVVIELEVLLRDQHGTIEPWQWDDLRRLRPDAA